MIFQPAEEGLGGARAMLADGLFDKFPCDEVYGMHNNPLAEPNKFGVKPGPAMAGATFFDITINGVGSHGAMPHHARDPIVIATALVQNLQSIVSRNVQPTQPAVLSVTQIHSGSAYNVVPDKAVISGTIRYFSDEVRDLIHDRLAKLCAGFAASYEVEIVPDLRPVFDVLMNDADLSEAYREVAAEIVGEENATITKELVTGSEDFADMLKAVPGAYCTLGTRARSRCTIPASFSTTTCCPWARASWRGSSKSAFRSEANTLQPIVLRNSGRKTGFHFSWNCSSSGHTS